MTRGERKQQQRRNQIRRAKRRYRQRQREKKSQPEATPTPQGPGVAIGEAQAAALDPTDGTFVWIMPPEGEKVEDVDAWRESYDEAMKGYKAAVAAGTPKKVAWPEAMKTLYAEYAKRKVPRPRR